MTTPPPGGNPFAAPTPGTPQPPTPGYGPPPGYGPLPGYAQPPLPGYAPPSGYAPPPGYGYAPPVFVWPTPPLPPLADWGRRLAANLVDGLFSGWPVIVGLVVFLTTFSERVSRVSGDAVTYWVPSLTGVIAYALATIVGIAIGQWNRTFRQGRTGQSVGKQVLGIRLVTDPTVAPLGPRPSTPGPAFAPIGALNAFLRDLVHAVDGFAYVGYLWPLWDAKKQTFADKIMKTVVIDAR